MHSNHGSDDEEGNDNDASDHSNADLTQNESNDEEHFMGFNGNKRSNYSNETTVINSMNIFQIGNVMKTSFRIFKK